MIPDNQLSGADPGDLVLAIGGGLEYQRRDMTVIAVARTAVNGPAGDSSCRRELIGDKYAAARTIDVGLRDQAVPDGPVLVDGDGAGARRKCRARCGADGRSEERRVGKECRS